MGLFFVAVFLPVIALALVPLLGLPEGVNTVLIGLSVAGGPDVLLVAAIALLGRAGVEELMSRSGSAIKRLIRWDSVSERRYRIGLTILVLGGIVLPNVVLFVWDDSIRRIGGSPGWGFYVLVGAAVAFVGAVLALGAPFWSRVEAIFRWDAEIVLPDD